MSPRRAALRCPQAIVAASPHAIDNAPKHAPAAKGPRVMDVTPLSSRLMVLMFTDVVNFAGIKADAGAAACGALVARLGRRRPSPPDAGRVRRSPAVRRRAPEGGRQAAGYTLGRARTVPLQGRGRADGRLRGGRGGDCAADAAAGSGKGPPPHPPGRRG